MTAVDKARTDKMRADKVRILVADDHTLLREAMRDLLATEDEFEVVGEAADGQAVVQQTARLRPHVVLLDLEMPRSRPVETVRMIRAASPMTKIVILSMHDEPHIIREMVQHGVAGYLHKSVSRHTLVAAIRAARQPDHAAGQRVMISVSQESLIHDPASSSSVLPSSSAALPSPPATLSAREREVLTLVAAALSNRQIASRLSITEATVKRHLRNIFAKLDAVSRIDAVNKATAASIIRNGRYGYRPAQHMRDTDAEPA